MRDWKWALMVALTAGLLATAACADEERVDASVEAHDRDPRAAVSAAFLNIFYMPLRIVTTLVGGQFAGFVGFMTGGNVHAANDTFDLVNGSQVITPKMINGTQPFHWTGYD